MSGFLTITGAAVCAIMAVLAYHEPSPVMAALGYAALGAFWICVELLLRGYRKDLQEATDIITRWHR